MQTPHKTPLLTDSLHRLLALSEDEKLRPQTFELLVAKDPALIARLVGLANSVAFNRAGTSTTTARQAIKRLGTRAAFDILLTSFAISAFNVSSQLAPILDYLCHHLFLLQTTAYRCAPILESDYDAELDRSQITLTVVLRKLGVLSYLGSDIPLALELERMRRENLHWFFHNDFLGESLKHSVTIAKSWAVDDAVIGAVELLANEPNLESPLNNPLAEVALVSEALAFAYARAMGEGPCVLGSDLLRNIPAVQRVCDKKTNPSSLVSYY